MKVLLITQYFFPEKTGISVVATDSARFISEYGHEVSVICDMPFYPEWKIHSDYKGRVFCTEMLGDLKLRRVWLYVPAKASTVRRILHELSFTLLASLRALVQRFDLLICISPPLTAGFGAALVSMIRRKRLWFFVQDIQPDVAVELGMIGNKRVLKLMYWVEGFIYSRSERVIVLSEGMARKLETKGVVRSKLSIIPVSIDIKELSSGTLVTGGFRRRYFLEDKFLVLYSGNIGVKHNPEIIVECAKRLTHFNDIFFAVVGEGAMKETVQDLIDKYRLANIRIYPLCERSELGEMLSSSDVLLAPQRKGVLDLVIPSKITSYLTSRRPVLASAPSRSEVARMLKDNGVGVVVEPENVDMMVEAILALKENRQRGVEIGKRGYEFVSANFSHEVVKERFYKPLFSKNANAKVSS
jgi:colanic acid biosynthesis glycosyl transferase WcaI